MKPKNILKYYFKSGDKPSQEQFWDLIDSIHGFASMSELEASTDTFDEGELVYAGDFRFRVASLKATDHDLTLPNGTKLYDAPFRSYTRGEVPSLLSAGTIEGSRTVGSALTVAGAAYAGDGVRITYQWIRNGVAISGATGAAYVPQLADTGATLARRMTATNTAGSVSDMTDEVTISPFICPVEFDPLNRTAAIIISGGTQVTTSSDTLSGVRADRYIEPGEKVYFEVEIPASSTASTYAYVGLTHFKAPLMPGAGAVKNDSITFVRVNGGVSGPSGYGDNVANACDRSGGDVIRVAVDRQSGKVYFGTNAGWTGDPVKGTGGFALPDAYRLVPQLNPRSTARANFVLRSLPSSFRHAIPAGFTAYGMASSCHESASIAHADDLVEMTGINVHLNWTTTFWATDVWKAPLYDLGVRYIRTAVGADPTAQASLKDAAAHGLRATVHVAPADNDGTNSPIYSTTKIDNQINAIRSYGVESVIALEGPNEPNGGSVTAGWADRATAAQQYVYDKIKKDAALSHLPILAITPWKRSRTAYAAMGSMAGMADKANLHYYTDGSRPTQANNMEDGDLDIEEVINDARAAVGRDRNLWVTEYGHRTYDADADLTMYTPEKTIAAKYIIRGLFEWFNRGAEKVFLYNLIDDPTTLDGYGLIAKNDTQNFVKRPAYFAVQRLLSLFSDQGKAFTAAPLRYILSGNLSDIRHHMFQKSDGTYLLAIWNDAQSWDRSTLSASKIPNRLVKLGLEREAATILRHLPTTTKAATAVGSNVYELDLAVPDELAVYEIRLS
ncbi:cellulase family glycosylhydrolase [Rhodobacteraceae bacterium DSL-40]|uniref:cellulase family glycosylhydrolase n=1 Tax=Amaricoccus sp. B4 TaxID=3368557 RepID=UPI0013A6A4AE